MKRLNKFITDAGYCSRREADAYIAQGRVTVNGRDAGIGSMVEDGDTVEIDDERVGKLVRRPVYIMLNKPVGVSSTSDRADKSNVIDFVNYKERIFHVGRLDKDSEGLMILTNDGDIVNKILRAGNDNPKEYIVTVDRPITGDFVARMSRGVRILGVMTKRCKVVRRDETTFAIHLTQGLNRQIRRMCQVLGYRVVKLKRIRVMNLTLGNLETGSWRYFTPDEIRDMHALLARSSGTEEASDEAKVKAKGNSFADYRKKGRGIAPKDGLPKRGTTKSTKSSNTKSSAVKNSSSKDGVAVKNSPSTSGSSKRGAAKSAAVKGGGFAPRKYSTAKKK